jgi:putative ABC transport system permease protein
MISNILLCLRVFAAYYRRAPLQAGAILVGITLAITLLTGVRAINENARHSYSEVGEQLSLQADWLVTPPAGQKTLDESVYFDLRTTGYSRSLAVLEGNLLDADGRRWQLQGSDIIAALAANNSVGGAGSGRPTLFNNSLPLAGMLSGQPLVVMSRRQSEKLADQGRLILGGTPLRVIVLDEKYQLGHRLLMDISLAQQLLNRPGRLSYIALFDPQSGQDPELKSILAGRALLSRSDSGDALDALTDSFHLNLTAMSLLAFIVGLFIAYNGIRYSLLKRQRLLIQLQQFGTPKAVLVCTLAAELFLLVLVGSCIGFILGLQLSHWLHPMVAMTLEQLYDATLLPGIWRWQWLFEALLLTVVASGLACSSLFIQLWRQPLARSIGAYHQQHSAVRMHRLQLLLALLLLVATVILLPFSQHHRFTMLLVGLVIVALPLALPWLLSALVSLLSRIVRKGLVGYQLAETRELIAPLSLAMMAMLLSVSANIAMHTLVGSFETTLRDWLNARMHADLYLRPAPVQMEQTVEFLQQQPGVEAVYSRYGIKSSYRGMPTYLMTRDEQTLRETALFKQAEPEVWQSFFAGESILINEPMAVRLKLNASDVVTLPALPDRPLRVSGVFYDYGNPAGEVWLAPGLWREQGFASVPLSLGVRYSGRPERLREMLKQQLNLPDAVIYDQQQIKQRAITIFNRTFAITRVLNSLTLAVAAIGLFTACIMLTESRTAAIARLYVLGVTRSRLTLMVVGQMLAMVLITCFIALPAGAFMGYLLTGKVTLQAFGWSIPMLWDWQACAEVVLLSLVASLIAVVLPLYRQTRRPLVSCLQSEVS